MLARFTSLTSDLTCVCFPLALQPFPLPQVKRVAKRLAEKKINLELDEGAIDYLSHKGYDPVFGGRPVKRAVQKELENPLARALLSGSFVEEDTILVRGDPEGGPLILERKRTGAAAPQAVPA